MQISIIRLQSMFSQIQFSDLSQFANVWQSWRILELFKVKCVRAAQSTHIDIFISQD